MKVSKVKCAALALAVLALPAFAQGPEMRPLVPSGAKAAVLYRQNKSPVLKPVRDAMQKAFGAGYAAAMADDDAQTAATADAMLKASGIFDAEVLWGTMWVKGEFASAASGSLSSSDEIAGAVYFKSDFTRTLDSLLGMANLDDATTVTPVDVAGVRASRIQSADFASSGLDPHVAVMNGRLLLFASGKPALERAIALYSGNAQAGRFFHGGAGGSSSVLSFEIADIGEIFRQIEKEMPGSLGFLDQAVPGGSGIACRAKHVALYLTASQSVSLSLSVELGSKADADAVKAVLDAMLVGMRQQFDSIPPDAMDGEMKMARDMLRSVKVSVDGSTLEAGMIVPPAVIDLFVSGMLEAIPAVTSK
ncbi:MAG: hypothetical protein K6F50_01470 [Kiritimatiellae bacterium]|nr:hypothetical protein [Kiritimatiellia bacterium]